jgi:hypothetical protein
MYVDFSLQNKDGDEGQSEGRENERDKKRWGRELRETESEYGKHEKENA